MLLKRVLGSCGAFRGKPGRETCHGGENCCSECTPPGEWDLMSANRNFLEPGKIINGTEKKKKKEIKLNPMFTPCRPSYTPVTNFLIFSLLSILGTQVSPSPQSDTGDPTPPWEFSSPFIVPTLWSQPPLRVSKGQPLAQESLLCVPVLSQPGENRGTQGQPGLFAVLKARAQQAVIIHNWRCSGFTWARP